MRRPPRRAALLAAPVLLLGGCQGAPSPLDPRTEGAARIADLGWLMLALATAVCVVVFGALGAALAAGRRRSPVEDAALQVEDEDVGGSRAVVLWGMVVPGAVILLTLGATIATLRATAGAGGPGGGIPAAHADLGGRDLHALGGADASALAVHVTGRQWWWEVRYPDEQVVTANELHLPTGRAARLTLTSSDVIHSFWVPQLAGKVDMVPGRLNALVLRVDQPGVYLGLCSEFCGQQHALMRLRVVVQPPDEFAAWLAAQRRPPPDPANPLVAEGRQVFLAAGCGECHTVRGTSESTAGPDLTHVASRRTLGAGSQTNTPANLAGWAADAQAMKKGSKMPPSGLDEARLRALVAYLERLE